MPSSPTASTNPALPRATAVSAFLIPTLALALLLAPAAARADEPGDEPVDPADARPLAEERWTDPEYGISLRLPMGVRTVSRSAADYQLRIADEDDKFLIGVMVRQSSRALDMTEVLVDAGKQIGRMHESSEFVAEYALVVEEVDVGVLMFRMPDDREDDAFYGQALVQIDPRTFAVVEVNSGWRDVDEARATFEAILETIELRGLEDLEKQRAREIQRGSDWRRDLGLSRLHDALIPEQRFRIVEQDEDVGYMLVLQEKTEQQDKPGIQITVRSRVVTDDANIDSEAIYFASDDDATEFWTVTTTQRPRRPVDERPHTYQETGIRTGRDIVVTREDPFGNDRQELEAAPVGYLPLAETWVLPQVLPNDRPARYGFYSYNSNDKRLTYRTEGVVPLLDGYAVQTRLRPNAPELEARFDADRTLRQKQLSPARTIIPTTGRELEQIWRNR